MGAYSYLRLGSSLFFLVREGYSLELASVFRDNDGKEPRSSRGEEGPPTEFVVTARIMRERLEVLGYTTERANDAVEEFFTSDAEDDRATLSAWIDALVMSAQDENDGAEELEDPMVWVDPRLILRLVLDRTPGHISLSLDIGEPAYRGYIVAADDLCSQAFAKEYGTNLGYGTLVVLTEGSTDAEFLRGALEVRRPHLAPYVRFLDYSDNRPEGGVAALARTLKAFAAAGIGNRVVALFDNDTAAEQELSKLDLASLPDHFRVHQLPDLALAKNYPTLGPTGFSARDVNGSACSLEFYLGQDVLRDENSDLVPVQWTGFNQNLNRYQGELLGKRGIQERFRSKVSKAHEFGVDIPEHWLDLDAVLDLVLGV